MPFRIFPAVFLTAGIITNIITIQEIRLKKFVLLHYGFEPPTQDIMNSWNNWFKTIEERLVETGSGFSAGIEVTESGTRDLEFDKDAITGYNVITAEDIEEAEKIAKTCPFITAIRVYEIRSI